MTTDVQHQPPESGLSEEMTLHSKWIEVKGARLHYVEDGEGSPILFLHGIPANLYLWRNVIPGVRNRGRAIALDLVGFGQSDLPPSGGSGALNQYSYLEAFISRLGLRDVTLVGTDLGSLFAMKYAADHPENVRGLVIFEGMLLPALEYYDQLSLMQKMMYAMFRSRGIAKSVLVDGMRIQRNIVPMMTARRLTARERHAYTKPYEEDVRRRLLVFEGPGPVAFPKRDLLREETATNESVVIMNENAKKLRGTAIPILVLYANPGVIMSEKGRELVRQRYPNAQLECVGRGKHFIAEDHPRKTAELITSWLEQRSSSDSTDQTLRLKHEATR